MNAHERRSDHDHNFKDIFVENSHDAITFAMPKTADYFQSEPEIIPIREETLKTFLSDSFMESDVPLLVKYQSTGFVFLIEHQHDPYKFSIHHLARCVSYLQEQHRCNVIPIVYFPNASPRSQALVQEFKSEFMGKRYHYFTYEVVVLKGFNAQDYLESPNIVARLMLPFMSYAHEKLNQVLDAAVQGVLELVDSTQRLRQSKYLDFLLQYFKLGKPEWEAYQTYLKQKNSEEVIDMINTMLKEQGRVEGWTKGRDDGLVEGQVLEGQSMLLTLLPQRLGPTPAEIEKNIRALTDLDRIHTIAARLLEIRDWQELEQLLNGGSKK